MTEEKLEPVNEEEITHTKFAKLLFRTKTTLREIHEATKVSYPTLIDLKMGRPKKYRPRTLRDIAAYLDVAVSELIEDGQDISDEATPFEKILKERGLTVHNVADATGISYPILQDLKNGKKKNYRERTLRDVATYLEVKPEDLLPKENKEEISEEAPLKMAAKDGGKTKKEK